jgi:hypothetical protein
MGKRVVAGNLTATEAEQLIARVQHLVDAIKPWTIAGLRNRAILGVIGYAWASLDAVLSMRVRDYYSVGERHWLRFIEDAAERNEIVDLRLEPLIEAYLEAAAIRSEVHTPLFRSILPGQRVSTRAIARGEIVKLIRRLESSNEDPTRSAARPRRVG